jgi:hypothetical protein
MWYFFEKKVAIYLSLGLHKGRTIYRRSLQPQKEQPALQNMKILYFFLHLWVIFALLDPDPATQINADPDPQPWLYLINKSLSGIQDTNRCCFFLIFNGSEVS